MKILLLILVLCSPAVTGSARADSDPAATQVLTTPTAQTLGEGDLRVANTMLTLTQFNYGLTDNLQLGVQTVYLFWSGMDLKYRFFQSERIEASVLAGGGLLMVDARTHSLYARPVVTFLVREREGREPIRLSIGASAVYNGTQGASGPVMNGFLSGELPLGPGVKLMGEINYVYDSERTFPGDLRQWTAGTLGARFYRQRVAVDAGLFIPFNEDLLGAEVVGIPLLSLSYLF